MLISKEIARRRTFAIISHPDAGKTTLTEKLLLYGGAVQLAGSVTARKNQRATTSDWMELEKQRGISISSTVLQFFYDDFCINLLDTPGHKDFSEDTYRVLTAVDAAVMVIDAGKGIQIQTRKLFEVCRRRGIPIFTFMNKLDRPARAPLELLDELETVLGIKSFPMNWPLGDGPHFKGVYDRLTQQVHLFEKTPGGVYRAAVKVKDIHDPSVKDALPFNIYEQVVEDLALLDGAGADFKKETVWAGELTPVFFGSAANNFGVQLMLDKFLELAPAPLPRISNGVEVTPEAPFSGFVFKIQGNMNPKHRDRVSFIRIVSGKFERDMSVWNTRNGKLVRLSNSQRMFARERETLDAAWAGDVIGIVGNYDFEIGDTLTEVPGIKYEEIPRFTPECFAFLHNPSPAKFKRFRDGLDQLLKEGVTQVFELLDTTQRVPLLGAVGPLQFEVLRYRLETEYSAESRLEETRWEFLRWLRKRDLAATEPSLPTGAALGKDSTSANVIFFPTKWSIDFFLDQNPKWEVSETPFESL
ncbi:MAG: peptide chain release factor 3 [Verrucomicrobiota bacterium]|nr:peptide chain release factor 3 [Verrucomicrobiota bacterium]